jgi:hypothetical protein
MSRKMTVDLTIAEASACLAALETQAGLLKSPPSTAAVRARRKLHAALGGKPDPDELVERTQDAFGGVP